MNQRAKENWEETEMERCKRGSKGSSQQGFQRGIARSKIFLGLRERRIKGKGSSSKSVSPHTTLSPLDLHCGARVCFSGNTELPFPALQRKQGFVGHLSDSKILQGGFQSNPDSMAGKGLLHVCNL